MVRRRSILGKLARYAALVALALLGAFAGLVALYAFAPPISTLMLARALQGKSYERVYVPLRDISPNAVALVVASEDATFCENDGVDWGALKEVLNSAGARGPSRGASTITMQTAKNLFLWPGRSNVRKGVEIGMALVLGKVWPKRRTLEVYLNIAEWGDGTFGIEAAARRYFKTSASRLSEREAALLATSLPNPIKRNPSHPTAFQNRLAAGLLARAFMRPRFLDCLTR